MVERAGRMRVRAGCAYQPAVLLLRRGSRRARTALDLCHRPRCRPRAPAAPWRAPRCRRAHSASRPGRGAAPSRCSRRATRARAALRAAATRWRACRRAVPRRSESRRQSARTSASSASTSRPTGTRWPGPSRARPATVPSVEPQTATASAKTVPRRPRRPRRARRRRPWMPGSGGFVSCSGSARRTGGRRAKASRRRVCTSFGKRMFRVSRSRLFDLVASRSTLPLPWWFVQLSAEAPEACLSSEQTHRALAPLCRCCVGHLSAGIAGCLRRETAVAQAGQSLSQALCFAFLMRLREVPLRPCPLVQLNKSRPV